MGRKPLKPEEGKPEHTIADDLDLNGAIGAVVGGSTPEPEPLEKPEIQPAGNFPSFQDAIADMSEPPPAPPTRLFVLNRSSAPPKAAFCVQPRVGKGLRIWMFSIPYGESVSGEAFAHPIISSLRESLLRECPALVPKRFEIRLLFDAGDKYSLLEVPADPFPTKKREASRQSLLAALATIEKKREMMLVTKGADGNWGAVDAARVFPVVWPAQSLLELAGSTYDPDMITNTDHATLERFRKKIGPTS
jgi:hypothetical protein